MKYTTQKFLSSIILSFFLFLAIANSAKAQFWTEDFATTNFAGIADGYIGANPGAWTLTTLPGNNVGGFPNVWYISCTESSMQPNNCGDVCPGIPVPPPTPYVAQSLHIGTGLLGDNGALYLETGGNATDTELRIESPTINCTGQTTINLSFNYIEFGESSNDNAQVWYFDGITWALLSDMPKTNCGDGQGGPCNVVPCDGLSQGFWTAFSIALPASADNNPNVKIGFYWQNIDDGVATDPSIAIGSIALTSPTTANTITAGNLIGPFCAGATANLPFASTGTFNTGNIYTAQLSDASGVFGTPPTFLGDFTSTANVGSIPLTFPANTPTGAGYLIQIVSNAPNATSTTIGPFTINAALPLSVTVNANPGTAICPGECVIFTATPTNGGAAPTYQWQVNGVNGTAPSTNATYEDCNLQAGDQVTVIVTSNLACVSNSPASSTAQTITIVATVPFSITLSTSPSPFTICSGDTVSLFASTTNGGPTPTFAWTANNILLPGFNNDTLVYSGTPIPLTDGTEICVIGTSSIPGCVTNSPDTICSTVTVISSVTPSVSIAADTTVICVGETVNFTSSVINGGTNPTYQWFVGANAVPAPQGTDSIFNSNSILPGDVVSLTITSNASCLTTPTDTSNIIAINILPFETPTISIAPNSGICPGQPITFISSSTGGGLNPQYQWLLNDTVLLGTGSNLTVNSSIFINNDTLTCNMISSYPCLLSDTAFSNNFNIQLLSPAEVELGADVSIFYGESYKTDPEINGAVNLGDFLWTPDSTLSCNTCINPIATPTLNTSYILIYRNSTGCVARDTIKVEVKPNYEVFIPTGFSPNGDNINDVFYARGTFIRAVNMKIWDRLGGLIFESRYVNYGWDGTKDFKDVNTGVYIYYITVDFLDGVVKEFKGNITLSR
jgi:gliding motility-associated-like protein